jgi:glycosyltransferase involved in cell wall biosynthesis
MGRHEHVEPAVAVVVVAWGAYAGEPLREALASVAEQDLPLELVLVDNASDVPLHVPSGAQLVRSRERLSTGAARNLGLAHVSAPLVVFLDADDVLLPGALATLVDGIAGRPRSLAFAARLIDGETGAIHRVPRRVAGVLARWPAGFALVNSVWSLLPLQGSTILRTHAVRAAGGYSDHDHAEDWALGACLAWRGRVSFGATPVLLYRWREDSLGRTSPAARLAANARAVRERLLAEDAVPRWLRPGLLAALQGGAIHLVRPLVRGARGLSLRR